MIRNEKNIKDFGNRIRELRKQRKYTQDDLAAILNTSKSYIVKLETGKIEIKLGTVFNLCKVFNLTLKELFDFPTELS